MKKIAYLLFAFGVFALFSGCTKLDVNPGFEGVVIEKPLFFGQGGIRNVPVEPGLQWTWFSNSYESYSRQPVQTKESFKDLSTSDGTPVDFDLYVTIQLQQGKSPILHSKFGRNWYKNILMPQLRSITRNEIRKFGLDDLRMNPATTDSIEHSIWGYVNSYMKEKEVPIDVIQISLGKAVPPDAVLQEAARTSAQKQRKKTEAERKEAEIVREAAERQKAISDKAYTDEFKMTTQQFLTNKWLDIIASKSNVNVVTGGTLPVVNVK